MAAHIPVSVTNLLGFLNLPSDMSANSIWEEHEPLVLDTMQRYLTPASYADAILESPTLAKTPFYSCYCFLMLSSTAAFLNLKTVGEGIVKSVGLDTASTDLLTQAEIESFASTMELRALKAARAYLSPEGIARLGELTPIAPKPIRIAVI